MSSSSPRRRLDVREGTPQRSTAGRRVAVRPKRRRTSLRPTPAMAGAFVLVVAGIGAGAVSSQTDGGALSAGYQTISASYSGGDGDQAAGSDVDFTKKFDQDLLARQTETQAQQVIRANEQLRDKAQDVANELRANQWVLPVTGYRITAQFGQSSSLWSSTHTGLDFAGPSGSTIVSVAAGEVVSTDYDGPYGNRTVIRLDDGTEIWYAHQSSFAVSVGDQVSPGQTIGYTGSTGNSTGPHLHLEVHPGGGPAVDPEPVLQEHGVTP